MSATIRPYRPCVGIMLLNQDNNVFVGKRIKPVSETWQMPQGGIDKGETPDIAVFRELQEETGITDTAVIIERSPSWFEYKLPKELANTLWRGRYAGQRQLWYLMRHTGPDSAINIHTAHPEFREWRWEDPSRLIELVVPFKRELYAQVIDAFSSHL